MPRYKRLKIKGGLFFFTLNLNNRNSSLLLDHIDIFQSTILKVKEKRPFRLYGWVVLPDHYHCIWRLPRNDYDYSGRWRDIKTRFSKEIRELGKYENVRVWQNRFWEHAIRDSQDFINHLDYIHINPVKHGLVDKPRDWAQSSFNYYVAKGMYSDCWGSTFREASGIKFGE